MRIAIFHVGALPAQRFSGNPAAVMPLPVPVEVPPGLEAALGARSAEVLHDRPSPVALTVR